MRRRDVTLAGVAEMLRVVVALVVAGLLGRAARLAWRNRALALQVWRRIRPGHVLGCLALLVVVMGTAVGLMTFVPLTGFGLGSLVGLTGNAVFAPLEEAVVRVGEPGGAASGTDWGLLAVTVGFLGALLALLPWLAYVEERVFREGLEHAEPAREAWTALRFGLVHLVMLIPVAAALAIAVAGFAYGRVYRAAYRRAAHRELTGPLGVPVVQADATRRARDEAVLTATVWHATFNSLIVVLVMIGFLATAW